MDTSPAGRVMLVRPVYKNALSPIDVIPAGMAILPLADGYDTSSVLFRTSALPLSTVLRGPVPVRVNETIDVP